MTIEESAALHGLENALAERPLNPDRIRDLTRAFARSQRDQTTPELVIVTVKRAFDHLTRDHYPGSHDLRDEAVRCVIEEYYRAQGE